jgi:hypothetical protein
MIRRRGLDYLTKKMKLFFRIFFDVLGKQRKLKEFGMHRVEIQFRLKKPANNRLGIRIRIKNITGKHQGQ